MRINIFVIRFYPKQGRRQPPKSGVDTRAGKKRGPGGLPPENFLGPRPPERQKTPLLQDRIKSMFIIDFTFWTLFASHNSLQTTNEKEKKLNLTELFVKENRQIETKHSLVDTQKYRMP